jgi:glycosyltransferase involved in cell wall biosynthesis
MKSELKVYLQITPFFPTREKFYGPYIYDQVKAIERNSDYKPIVIKVRPALNPERPDRTKLLYEYDGINVYNFDVIDLPSSTLPGLFGTINFSRFLDLLKSIPLDPEEISFVHAHTVYPAGFLANELKKKFNIPSIIQHHGLDVFQFDNGRLLKGFLKVLNNQYKLSKFMKIVNDADLNVGVSQKVLDRLGSLKGFRNPSTYVLYNGVDTTKFHPVDQPKATDDFIIGCIGNFWPLKDHITLLKAMKILKEKGFGNIHLKLIGSGSTLPECKKFITKHGLEETVSFEKELDHRKLNEFYNMLDLFVLPSYYEAFGCVYTEAMQTGVPIIAVKGQGIEEVLKEADRGKGLIEKGDYRHLAELIEFRYNHNDRVDYDFNIDQYIKDFVRLIEILYPRTGAAR